jgi:replicative DNA helicase
VTSTATSDRTPPHNLEAEKAVLGAVLLQPDALTAASDVLTPRDFYRDAHRRIFETMLVLGDRQSVIDPITLKDELYRHGRLDEIGGPSYIAGLLDGVGRSANVAHYARVIKAKAQLRSLIAGASSMLRDAYTDDEEADVILERAERAIVGLADDRSISGFESMRSIAERGMALLEARVALKQSVNGVPSGFTDLDELTHGFQPGTLVILGARPGIGKSSFGVNVAQYVASTNRVVGLFSLEMPSEELFVRQLAAEAHIDGHRLQSGQVKDREWGLISAALAKITESSVYIDPTPAVTIFEVRSRARRLKVEHGLDLIILDYLQLMSSRDRKDTRALELGAISAGLKNLAKELRIPILALSQLSREIDKRGDRPRLSDLRDSGSLEADADIVLFLHRQANPKDDELGRTDLIVAKHRSGPVGTIRLSWFEEQTRFANYTSTPAPEDRRLPMGDR